MQEHYSSNIFYVLTIGISQLASAIFTRLLFFIGNENNSVVPLVLYASATLWTIGAIPAVALQCNPRQPWALEADRCGTTVRFRLFIECYTANTDC